MGKIKNYIFRSKKAQPANTFIHRSSGNLGASEIANRTTLSVNDIIDYKYENEVMSFRVEKDY